ncbi:hypothetical protein [Ruminococcus flavefaciens]|uniref:Uncharacterized protein n=1 Tax=Ruminococcus flavefaciens TaxID=1265 RepID=A0A1M7J0N3_RUMFL|nr:hypothetical protein [Ruminococcus flavefaciens]SHM45997.1 hypothetical protein SAMN04487860_10534 [Ruminococcus flavefaciens]
MRIHFYEVKDCTYDMVQGIPAIFAPDGVDEEVLQRHFFIKTAEGKWFHYLTREEYYYLISMSYSGNDEVVFSFDKPITNYYPPYQPLDSESENKANTMCGISLGLMGMGFILAIIGGAILTFPCWIAAIILMIIVRVNYPQNTFGKVLMIIYIIFGILLMIGFIMVAITCNIIAKDFLSCCENMPK